MQCTEPTLLGTQLSLASAQGPLACTQLTLAGAELFLWLEDRSHLPKDRGITSDIGNATLPKIE